MKDQVQEENCLWISLGSQSLNTNYIKLSLDRLAVTTAFSNCGPSSGKRVRASATPPWSPLVHEQNSSPTFPVPVHKFPASFPVTPLLIPCSICKKNSSKREITAPNRGLPSLHSRQA